MLSLKNRDPAKLNSEKEITIRKYLLELQQNYMKYRSVYEGFPALCCTINTDGIILDCNESYANHLGHTKKEVIGSSIFSHVADDSFDAMNDSFESWKKTGRVVKSEVWFKKKDGTTFPALISATNLYDVDGTIIGSNTIIKDISELHVLRETEKAKKELERKDIQKEKFVSMVTHDLKNLLVPIQLYCELLKDTKGLGSLNDEQSDAVNEIHQTLMKLDRLVSDIHDVHRLDLRQMKFNNEIINVNDLMGSITRNHLPLMNEKKIKFVNNSPQETLIIISDEDRLFQVFSNLIKNAIDFLPKENPKIEIGVILQHQYVIFYASDNGRGIPREEQEKIFREFFQVDEINKGTHIGSGLGLAICKGIVEGMGGRLWVESNEGEGTIFYFSIPKGGEKK